MTWETVAQALEALADALARSGDVLGEAGLFLAMCAILARAMGIEGADVVDITHELVNAKGGQA
jgi:hypothetical protein